MIYDAYVNYRYEPALQLRIGKFKTPIGLEQLVTDRDLSFNERSLVTDLVPNRDVGAQLWGDVSGGVLSYAAGIFNGVGDARNSSNGPFDDNKTFAGGDVLDSPTVWVSSVASKTFTLPARQIGNGVVDAFVHVMEQYMKGIRL